MANGEGQQDPEGQENPPEDGTPEGSQSQTPGQGPQDGGRAQGQGGEAGTDPSTGGQTGFTHPALQGKDREEIERFVTQMERTVREQGQTLTQLQQQRQQEAQQAQQAGQEELDISDEEFFDRPVETVRQVVGQQLQETVKPLADQLSQMSQRDQAQTLLQHYRSQYPNWDEFEPYMKMLAQRKGLDWNNVLAQEGVVEVLYYAVKGLQGDQQGRQGPSQAQQPGQGQQMGQGQPSPQQQQPQGQQGQQAQGRQQPPPQHRPSSSPMPGSARQGQSQGQTRQLTEQEKRLAREYNMSEQEFIEWQEMDARDAVTGPRPGQEE